MNGSAKAPAPLSADERRARDIAQLDYEFSKQEELARLSYQVEYSQSTLKNLTFVNGGSVVALFTFIAADKAKFDDNFIWQSFAFFVVGLTATLVAFICAFLSQHYFMLTTAYQRWNPQRRIIGSDEPYKFDSLYKNGSIALFVGLTFSIIGLIGFICGAIAALRGVL